MSEERKWGPARFFVLALFVLITGAALYMGITAGAAGLGFGKKVTGKVTDSVSSVSCSRHATTSCGREYTYFGYVVEDGRQVHVEIWDGAGHVGKTFTTHLPFFFSEGDTIYIDDGSARTRAIASLAAGLPIGGFFGLIALAPEWLPRKLRGKFKQEDRSWAKQQTPQADASPKQRYFQGLGYSYRSGDGADGESMQQLVGPYRGCTLQAMTERRWIGYQGTTYGDGGVEAGPRRYRNVLRVSVDITPEVPSLIVYQRKDYGASEPLPEPSRFDKFYCGQDALRSASLIARPPHPTGHPAFDQRYAINCDNELAGRMMTADLLGWIAADPRTANFRIMVFGTEISACFLGPVGPRPDDIFDPDHIFPAADYLIDLVQHVSPDVFRLAPADQPAVN